MPLPVPASSSGGRPLPSPYNQGLLLYAGACAGRQAAGSHACVLGRAHGQQQAPVALLPPVRSFSHALVLCVCALQTMNKFEMIVTPQAYAKNRDSKDVRQTWLAKSIDLLLVRYPVCFKVRPSGGAGGGRGACAWVR